MTQNYNMLIDRRMILLLSTFLSRPYFVSPIFCLFIVVFKIVNILPLCSIFVDVGHVGFSCKFFFKHDTQILIVVKFNSMMLSNNRRDDLFKRWRRIKTDEWCLVVAKAQTPWARSTWNKSKFKSLSINNDLQIN